MPLLDHFHPPLRNVLQWNSFHSAWLTALAADFNRELPPRFYAEPSTRFGIEVDVAALERITDSAVGENYGDWTPTYTAPTAALTVPFAIGTDALEVLVYEDYPGEIRLVGAVEFVSPANKDRPEKRNSFVGKCAALLQKGVAVSVVDLVTVRHFNLYAELMAFIGHDELGPGANPPPTYASSCRWVARGKKHYLETWSQALTVGQPLPTIPLWLAEDLMLRLDLEPSYEQACHDLWIA